MKNSSKYLVASLFFLGVGSNLAVSVAFGESGRNRNAHRGFFSKVSNFFRRESSNPTPPVSGSSAGTNNANVKQLSQQNAGSHVSTAPRGVVDAQQLSHQDLEKLHDLVITIKTQVETNKDKLKLVEDQVQSNKRELEEDINRLSTELKQSIQEASSRFLSSQAVANNDVKVGNTVITTGLVPPPPPPPPPAPIAVKHPKRDMYGREIGENGNIVKSDKSTNKSGIKDQKTLSHLDLIKQGNFKLKKVIRGEALEELLDKNEAIDDLLYQCRDVAKIDAKNKVLSLLASLIVAQVSYPDSNVYVNQSGDIVYLNTATNDEVKIYRDVLHKKIGQDQIKVAVGWVKRNHKVQDFLPKNADKEILAQMVNDIASKGKLEEPASQFANNELFRALAARRQQIEEPEDSSDEDADDDDEDDEEDW